ncbi:hypothetical protein OG884_15715 [Streptosporangium sp. NBC_01755]|uniref:hypothetical protein n=1 Tax=Streptosporangium sp. NBC_01755 TaxID=2975949 RepID=UPI002DDAA022|nr:hypothetical protein [Streptosporangium sp. NBC_01755]WSD03281.1 hypothetical protein OG884_15715 [Streptosporangium sp. NBC_01755]
MPRDLRAAVLHYLRTGAVTVLTASTPTDGPKAPLLVHAHVAGYRSTHRVSRTTAGWTCSCRYSDCAHIAAVAMVTGHSTPVRPEPPAPHHPIPINNASGRA